MVEGPRTTSPPAKISGRPERIDQTAEPIDEVVLLGKLMIRTVVEVRAGEKVPDKPLEADVVEVEEVAGVVGRQDVGVERDRGSPLGQQAWGVDPHHELSRAVASSCVMSVS